MHDINEMDLKASIARFQTSTDTQWVTFGYLWMNWRGCPAFVEEISGGVGVPYANVPRLLELISKGGILFDDESGNVHAWQRDTMSGKAVRIKDETTLLDALESLIVQELE